MTFEAILTFKPLHEFSRKHLVMVALLLCGALIVVRPHAKVVVMVSGELLTTSSIPLIN